MRHAVLDVRNDCFCERHMKPDSMTQVLSHTRKITCAGVRRMRGFGVVFTPVSYKGIAIACMRNTFTLGLQEKSLFIPT